MPALSGRWTKAMIQTVRRRRQQKPMSDEAIFLLSAGALTPMVETPYDNEAILQKALEEYPALLAGSATGGDASSLLLVRREMPVSDSAGVQSMRLDHLFIDSSGVPVLVEVKRSRTPGLGERSWRRCWTTRQMLSRTGLSSG